jgi:hypothetical protein
VLIVIVVCFGGWLMMNPSTAEPTYGGHPLSYWANQMEPDPAENPYRPVRLTADSAAVVHSIGTNAFPTLLQWMTRLEEGLDATVLNWSEDDRIPLQVRRMLEAFFPKTYQPHIAVLVFRVLGSEATDAIPSLVPMLHSPLNSRHAAMALCAIGPDGAGALTNRFPEIGNAHVRANIVLQLEHEITPESEAFFARFLTEQLARETDYGVQMSLCRTLGTLTNCADVAVPALVNALHSKQNLFPIMALAQFGPAAISAVGPIRDALTDSNPYVRTNAALALIAIQGSVPVENEDAR